MCQISKLSYTDRLSHSSRKETIPFTRNKNLKNVNSHFWHTFVSFLMCIFLKVGSWSYISLLRTLSYAPLCHIWIFFFFYDFMWIAIFSWKNSFMIIYLIYPRQLFMVSFSIRIVQIFNHVYRKLKVLSFIVLWWVKTWNDMYAYLNINSILNKIIRGHCHLINWLWELS